MLELKDPSKNQLRKIRQCFIYERQYFMVEIFSEIVGRPSILRIETTGEAQKIHIPPFINVLREVTNDPFYETKVMAEKDYIMPEHDKDSIAQQLLQEANKQSRQN